MSKPEKNQKNEEILEIKKTKIKSNKDSSEKTEDIKVKVQKVPNRKVLFFEIDDEITTICDRIKKTAHKKVFLVVPQRALLFQSLVNLKILKRQCEEIEKEIAIVTNDSCGIHMAQNLGLSVFSKIENNIQDDQSEESFDKFLHIQPLEAGVNSFKESLPSRLASKKMSIMQLVKTVKNREVAILPKKIRFKSIFSRKQPTQKKKNQEKRFLLTSPNRHAVFSIVTVSVLLFLGISYIALPSATIVLSAKSNVIEKSTNINLVDAAKNRIELESQPLNTISTYPSEIRISHRVTHPSSGREFQGTNASGKITVINTSSDPWALIANTRFQNPDGIVFRTQSYVSVPAATASNPGKLEIPVVADPLDAYEQPVGDKGNIEPSKFFLPGLSAENQKKIFAESSAPMTGGTSGALKFITEQDIQQAREKLERALETEAQTALERKIEKENLEKSLNMALVKNSETYSYKDLKIEIPEKLIGQKLDEFELFGEVTIQGVMYNKGELINIMRNELNAKKNPEKRLVSIDDSSLTYKIFEIDPATQKIKLTASIKGLEEFDISPDRENGMRLIQKIKTHISGQKAEDAKNFIQNLPEINKVEISTWPFWAPTIPQVAENIKVVID